MLGGRAGAFLGAVGVAALVGGCGLSDSGTNLVNGKTQFVEKCAACHTLARANASGTTGPNLDQAWQQAKADGFGRSTYQGVVHRQILQPARSAQWDPKLDRPGAAMPANLVTGADAEDVAAYVAEVAAEGGEDTGRLAAIGQKSDAVAKEENGTLNIPVGAGLSYEFGSAEAQAGEITFNSKNEQPVDHDIAVEGNGVDAKGEIVRSGGTSTFSVELNPGEYTFYCSVPGHREGGMEGKLTVN